MLAAPLARLARAAPLPRAGAAPGRPRRVPLRGQPAAGGRIPGSAGIRQLALYPAGFSSHEEGFLVYAFIFSAGGQRRNAAGDGGTVVVAVGDSEGLEDLGFSPRSPLRGSFGL